MLDPMATLWIIIQAACVFVPAAVFLSRLTHR